MNININDLSYFLCPGSMPEKQHVQKYNAIYDCWHSVWTAAFKELNVNKNLYSDPFSRQDYVGALFHKETCLGMAFFRWADPSRLDFSMDSYFSNWEKNDLTELSSRGNNIIVCSNFTVHPAARGSNLGISGKDLLLGMVVETFLQSNANAMTAAVRIDRGVSKLCTRWGAKLIRGEVPCEYGEKNTDLLGFFKDYIAQQPPNFMKPLAEDIWSRRIVIPRIRVGYELNNNSKNNILTESPAATA